jgi:hypothetical protein
MLATSRQAEAATATAVVVKVG